MLAKAYSELHVYQQAFALQQRIFEISKRFPAEERYALTDQIRRSSRSIGANIAEAWAKRRYVAHFTSKLTDADGEASETDHWLKTAQACRYLSDAEADELADMAGSARKMLGAMLSDPTVWCPVH